ncbi:photosystem I assembly protein Ycf3, putative [Medicago truncatula]|uniref:Photosystem I assembly protein Ycf3, putative n=1 Tax=Medicago truncatula TaxID=3880 RepID=G7ZW79_MEDTR|nr:photosystem I assembly protein Ycf3, putative [Medicago truncatula]KEH29744.1 photosystem I assembly protein Ycf3, putative [Medicago truncatula]
MTRSRINGNFIDKTFTIVANILLRIIPTTSGEKEAFTYYRDGNGWDNKHPSRSYFGYPYNHRRLLK